MKDKVKKFISKRPVLEKYVRFLASRKNIFKLFPKKNIKGNSNSFKIAKSATLYNCKFNIIGSNNSIDIEDSTVFNHVDFYIKGDYNKIKIGNKARFNRGGSIWIEDNNCKAIIGDNTTFEDVHIAVTEHESEISIGEDCMFAYDIDIRTGDSHSIINTKTNKRINHAQNIKIGDHVWVASHVSILKGTKIPDNSIVATRAVVTKPFEEKNILLAGMPAKKIKDDVNWDRQRL